MEIENGSGSGSESKVSKVDKGKLMACMTCPLCNDLFNDATTISECLHTFCRKCIYEKLTEEMLRVCPVCKIDLGCAPLDKLRTDNNWQDIKMKLFPSKERKLKEPKAKGTSVVPSPIRRNEIPLPSLVVSTPRVRNEIPLPSLVVSTPRVRNEIPLPSLVVSTPRVRNEIPLPSLVVSTPRVRNEIPLPSLVVSTPRVYTKSRSTGRRSKLTPRKALTRQETPLNEEPVSKLEDTPKSLSSPDKYSKVVQNRMQNFSVGEPSKQHVLDRSTGSIGKALEDKVDWWKPVNGLVESASGTNPNNVLLQQNTTKPAQHSLDNEVNMPTVKESGNGPIVPGKENGSTPERSTSVRPTRSQGIQQKGKAICESLNISAQPVVDSRSKYDGRRLDTIWFSLVSSKSRKGVAPLPQISSCYLRVKDGNVPVSTIKKYLVRKLGLPTETKVDIIFQGQPVRSKLPLRNLVEWWMKNTPSSERVQTFSGSSAKDHVIELLYSLKTRSKQQMNAVLALEAVNKR